MRKSVLLFGMLAGGCAPNFYKALTPSGTPCSDMPIFPAGVTIARPYHRLRPVASDPARGTEAERLESLRAAACNIGGDGVIEAANEETRTVAGTYATRASGTAIVWLRGSNTGASSLPISGSTLPSTTTAPVETSPAQPTAADEAATTGTPPAAAPAAPGSDETEAPPPPPPPRKKKH